MVDLHQALAHLRSGRWADAHDLVQRDDPPSLLAAWLHGILHLQEGDLENASYWYAKAKQNFRGRGTVDEEIERFEAQLRRT